MTIIETRNFNDYVNKATTYQGTFQTAQDKKSKFAAYLDSLYSYPPKIKIKWNGLDEFTDDLLVEENSGFIDTIENWFFNTNPQEKSNEACASHYKRTHANLKTFQESAYIAFRDGAV